MAIVSILFSQEGVGFIEVEGAMSLGTDSPPVTLRSLCEANALGSRDSLGTCISTLLLTGVVGGASIHELDVYCTVCMATLFVGGLFPYTSRLCWVDALAGCAGVDLSDCVCVRVCVRVSGAFHLLFAFVALACCTC